MRVVLKCASMDHGAQWVVVDGVLWTLKWCAGNLALVQLVSARAYANIIAQIACIEKMNEQALIIIIITIRCCRCLNDISS